MTAPRLYLAGPMSGIPDHNRPAFHDAARELRDLGYEVVSPAEVTEGDLGVEATYAAYLRHDLRLLLDCDHVATLDRWWGSTGARQEVQVAGTLGMEVRSVSEWVAKGFEPEGEAAVFVLHDGSRAVYTNVSDQWAEAHAPELEKVIEPGLFPRTGYDTLVAAFGAPARTYRGPVTVEVIADLTKDAPSRPARMFPLDAMSRAVGQAFADARHARTDGEEVVMALPEPLRETAREYGLAETLGARVQEMLKHGVIGRSEREVATEAARQVLTKWLVLDHHPTGESPLPGIRIGEQPWDGLNALLHSTPDDVDAAPVWPGEVVFDFDGRPHAAELRPCPSCGDTDGEPSPFAGATCIACGGEGATL